MGDRCARIRGAVCVIFRLFLLASSLASALGNFVFLIGLETAQAYIYSLSLSSLFVGAFGYAVLPNLVFGQSFARVFWLLFGLAVCALGIAAISAIAGLVLLTILTFLSAEIVLSAHGAWRQLTILRITMLLTGLLSWVLADHPAVMFRAFGVAATVFITLQLARLAGYKAEGAPKIASIPLLGLVATNLVWVYILPLYLIGGVALSEQKVIYILATVCPLLYFKAQDAVFKLDILARTKGGGSPWKFLLAFAVPLAVFYFLAPFVRASFYGDEVFGISVLFSLLSLVFLAMNFILTSWLYKNNAQGAKLV